MTASRSRRSKRLTLAVLLLVPLALVGAWLSTREEEAAGSRFDRSLDRALAPVLRVHEATLDIGASTHAQTRLLARQAAASSLQYLAPADLELWAATRLRVARASPRACAKLWRGGDAAFVGQAVAELGDAPLDDYTDMLARALSLRLERRPPPEPRSGAIQRGVQAIAEGLSPELRAAFLFDISRPEVSAARACELFLLLSTGAEKLPSAERLELLRALAKELPVRGL